MKYNAFRKEQSERLALPAPGTMRKPRLSHKHCASTAFAPLEKLS